MKSNRKNVMRTVPFGRAVSAGLKMAVLLWCLMVAAPSHSATTPVTWGANSLHIAQIIFDLYYSRYLGANSLGQLGDGSNTSRNVPVAVSTTGVLAGKTITAVAAGYEHSLALASDGRIYTWGINISGQLGDGSNTYSNVPVAVSTTGVLAGKTITAIPAGGSHSLALASDGSPPAGTSGISGAVKDVQGTLLPSSIVEVWKNGTQWTLNSKLFSVQSGADGKYEISNLPAENYYLRAYHAGHEAVSKTSVVQGIGF